MKNKIFLLIITACGFLNLQAQPATDVQGKLYHARNTFIDYSDTITYTADVYDIECYISFQENINCYYIYNSRLLSIDLEGYTDISWGYYHTDYKTGLITFHDQSADFVMTARMDDSERFTFVDALPSLKDKTFSLNPQQWISKIDVVLDYKDAEKRREEFAKNSKIKDRVLRKSLPGNYRSLILNDDGTFGYDGIGISYSGHWSLKNGVVTLTEESRGVKFYVLADGKNLITMLLPGDTHSYVLRRMDDNY